MADEKKRKVGRPKNILKKEILSPYRPRQTIVHNLETGEKKLNRKGKDIFHDLSLVHSEEEFISLINKYEELIQVVRKQSLIAGRKTKEFRKDSLWKSGLIDSFQSYSQAWKHHLPKAKNEHRDRAIMLSIFAFEMGVCSVLLLHDYPDAIAGANRRIKREKSVLKNRVSGRDRNSIANDFNRESSAKSFNTKTALLNYLAKKYGRNEKTIRNILKEKGIN